MLGKPKWKGIQSAKAHHSQTGTPSFLLLTKNMRRENPLALDLLILEILLYGPFKCLKTFTTLVPAVLPSSWVIPFFWPVLVGIPPWRLVVFLWTTRIRFMWALKVVVPGPAQAEPLGSCTFTKLLRRLETRAWLRIPTEGRWFWVYLGKKRKAFVLSS